MVFGDGQSPQIKKKDSTNRRSSKLEIDDEESFGRGRLPCGCVGMC